MFSQGLLNDGEGVAPEFFGVVFDAAGCGDRCGRCSMEKRSRSAASKIEDERLGGGGALVDGEDVTGHGVHLCTR